jgi:hypothetical protein
MSKFIGHLEFEVLGVMCELPVECTYDYQPAEPETRHDPGCAESITITSARISGNQMLDRLDQEDIASLERQAGDIEGIRYESRAAAREDYEYDMRQSA